MHLAHLHELACLSMSRTPWREEHVRVDDSKQWSSIGSVKDDLRHYFTLLHLLCWVKVVLGTDSTFLKRNKNLSTWHCFYWGVIYWSKVQTKIYCLLGLLLGCKMPQWYLNVYDKIIWICCTNIDIFILLCPRWFCFILQFILFTLPFLFKCHICFLSAILQLFLICKFLLNLYL